MIDAQQLLKRNEEYAQERLALDAEYFSKVARGQSPPFMWIGCSDSRVSGNLITKSCEGELFVHCNIANQASNSDASLTSALEFAVEVLKISHIVVCGHYDCGGIKAAVEQPDLPQVKEWVARIREVYDAHRHRLDSVPDKDERLRRIVDLNVIDQVQNLQASATVAAAWARGQELAIHGWVYDLSTGRIKDLGVTVTAPQHTSAIKPELVITGLPPSANGHANATPAGPGYPANEELLPG